MIDIVRIQIIGQIFLVDWRALEVTAGEEVLHSAYSVRHYFFLQRAIPVPAMELYQLDRRHFAGLYGHMF